VQGPTRFPVECVPEVKYSQCGADISLLFGQDKLASMEHTCTSWLEAV
jgi:hypothetical protein